MIRIGGTVLDRAGAPIPSAWVRVETLDGSPVHTTHTNTEGRYLVDRLTVGRYRCRARAVGLGERQREIAVPESSGNYDIAFD